ncbi:hypothetical protein, partial [Mesorhizobium sp. M2A.F.Ca.ET.039.01.1.1]|uniref:hypothetical protein n=1 Tax=Mesorhizobium sp. M2A.F.Ca.ET.039.01.1.1 TaxID=2496746 RepID=UPI001AECBC65
ERQLCLWRPPLDACSVAHEGLVYFKARSVPVLREIRISFKISMLHNGPAAEPSCNAVKH